MTDCDDQDITTYLTLFGLAILAILESWQQVPSCELIVTIDDLARLLHPFCLVTVHPVFRKLAMLDP